MCNTIRNLHLRELISMDFLNFLLHIAIIFNKILNTKPTEKKKSNYTLQDIPVKLVL